MTTQTAAFPRSSASGDFAAISRIGAVAAATIFALTGLVLGWMSTAGWALIVMLLLVAAASA